MRAVWLVVLGTVVGTTSLQAQQKQDKKEERILTAIGCTELCGIIGPMIPNTRLLKPPSSEEVRLIQKKAKQHPEELVEIARKSNNGYAVFAAGLLLASCMKFERIAWLFDLCVKYPRPYQGIFCFGVYEGLGRRKTWTELESVWRFVGSKSFWRLPAMLRHKVWRVCTDPPLIELAVEEKAAKAKEEAVASVKKRLRQWEDDLAALQLKMLLQPKRKDERAYPAPDTPPKPPPQLPHFTEVEWQDPRRINDENMIRRAALWDLLWECWEANRGVGFFPKNAKYALVLMMLDLCRSPKNSRNEVFFTITKRYCSGQLFMTPDMMYLPLLYFLHYHRKHYRIDAPDAEKFARNLLLYMLHNDPRAKGFKPEEVIRSAAVAARFVSKYKERFVKWALDLPFLTRQFMWQRLQEAANQGEKKHEEKGK